MSCSATVYYNSGSFIAYLNLPNLPTQPWSAAIKAINQWAIWQDPVRLKTVFENRPITIEAQGYVLPVEVMIARMNLKLHTDSEEPEGSLPLTQSYQVLHDGPNTKSLTQEQSQSLNKTVREIVQDPEYIQLVEAAGLTKEIALSVFPMISNVSGFTIHYNGKAYQLGMTDKLREKIRAILG